MARRGRSRAAAVPPGTVNNLLFLAGIGGLVAAGWYVLRQQSGGGLYPGKSPLWDMPRTPAATPRTPRTKPRAPSGTTSTTPGRTGVQDDMPISVYDPGIPREAI